MQIPDSTMLMTFTAVGFALMSNLFTRRFVDLDQERRIKAEINQYQAAMKAAVKNNDKKEQERLKKKETSINQMRLKMSSARTKVGFATIIPFIVIYYLVIYLAGPCPVAISPIPITIGNYLMSTGLPAGISCPGVPAALQGAAAYVTPFGWYLISSFSFSTLTMRLLKTQT